MEVPPSLHLFTPPKLNATYYNEQYVECRTKSQLNTGGPIEFTIAKSGSLFTDLSKTLLHVKVQLKAVAGVAATVGQKVSPVNLLLHSLFKQVELFLQQQPVESDSLYAYKAYIKALLKTEQSEKATTLVTQGFIKDVAPDVDENDPAADDNKGKILTQRLTNFMTGRTVHMSGPLLLDLCMQKRLILNGVEIGLKLSLNSDNFVILSATDDVKFNFVITEAYLEVCKVSIESTTGNEIMKQLETAPVLYPYIHTDIKTYEVVTGRSSFHQEDMFQSQIPSKVLIFMVKSDAFNGIVTKNPYYFENAKLKSATIHIDTEMFKPIKCNFTTFDYSDAYIPLMRLFPKCGIEDGEFWQGYSIFSFELSSSDLKSSWPPCKTGNFIVDCQFSVPLPQTTTILIYAEFPAMLKIDHNRGVHNTLYNPQCARSVAF